MARYASGKKAWGYSDRSGFRYRLRDMIKEWNGLKVGRDEYEAKHPQLEPNYPGPDPTALYEPRPDRIQILKAVYEEEFQRAMSEDANSTPLKLTPNISYLRY